MLQFLEAKFLLIDGHTAPQCFLCVLFTRIWVTEHMYRLQLHSCPCTKMQQPQSTVWTGTVSLFPGLPFSQCILISFFHSCSAHIPLSLFLAHARSHSVCLGETQARVLPVCIFINKTYKEINGNLKATKIYKNIYFERAKQVPLKDTLYLCCVQLRFHLTKKEMVVKYMELMLFFL